MEEPIEEEEAEKEAEKEPTEEAEVEEEEEDKDKPKTKKVKTRVYIPNLCSLLPCDFYICIYESCAPVKSFIFFCLGGEDCVGLGADE